MVQNIFFHPFVWDNDVWIVYIVWVLLIPVCLWLIRFVHKYLRKKKMRYKGGIYMPCRDLFMQMNGYEYLIVAIVFYAIYLGFWAWMVNPANADWLDWKTYCIILPQIATLVVIVVMFIYRYTNFRKPYKK